jgi:hypothetical protein
MKSEKEKHLGTRKDWRELLKQLQEKRKSFTEPLKDFLSSAVKKTTSGKKGRKSLLYETVDTFPLTSFVDMLFDDSLEKIYRKKPFIRYSRMVEQAAFRELYMQYIERMHTDAGTLFLHQKRYATTAAKIAVLNSFLLLLSQDSNIDKIKHIIASFGIRTGENKEVNVARIAAERDKAIRECGKIMEAMQKNKELQSVKREWYLEMCGIMSSHFGFSIPYLTVTVGEFCNYINLMNKQVKERRKNHDRPKYK